MTKTELIREITNRTNITKKDAENAVSAFTDIVTEELAAGRSVQLPGFGVFEVSARSARTGRNPRTGEVVEIPASRTPKFRAGNKLKTAVKA